MLVLIAFFNIGSVALPVHLHLILPDRSAHITTAFNALKPEGLKEICNPDTNDVVLSIVEVMPEFPGGDPARVQYIQENLWYPVKAQKKGIQGRVFVTFVVEADGSITNVKLLRGIGGGCDEAAVEVISNMPQWIPGSQDGKPVRVQYNLPVLFRSGNSENYPNNGFYFSPQADKHFDKGKKFMVEGNFDAAIKQFTKSFKKDGVKKAESIAFRALCFYETGDMDAVMKDLKIASEFLIKSSAPIIASVYYNLGVDAFNGNRFNESIDFFTKGLEIYPEDAEMMFSRGNVYETIGEVQKACGDWLKARELGFEDEQGKVKEMCK